MKPADFDNLHRGQRAFAIGNGPSLNQMDLSRLSGEITFAANRFYQFADRVGFCPTYLCVSDPHVHREIAGDLPALPCTCFLPDIPGYYRPDTLAANELALPYVWGPGNWLTGANFRRTMTGTFHSGNTVVIDFMIQLAYCMGITELYLIGCDCTKTRGRHFFNSQRTQEPTLRRELVADRYSICRAVFETDGRQLCNAGVGGALKTLPRIDFDTLFEGVAA